jgi:hypothetical protein
MSTAVLQVYEQEMQIGPAAERGALQHQLVSYSKATA